MLTQINNFIALWVIIDPIAALSIFIAVTGDLDRRDRRRVALMAIVMAFAVLVFFIALGQIIIEAMGVSLREFQIAGGMILFMFAATMVIGQAERPELPVDQKTPSGLAVYPLAVPTLAGPGAMMTVMLLTDNSRFSIVEQALTTATVAVVLAITLVMLLFANPIIRVIGPHGANVMKRIMGMILAAVAVKIVLGGFSDWLRLTVRPI